MGLDLSKLATIAAAVDDPASLELAGRLRTQFPGLTFTVCADDDVIGSKPALEGDGFNLYLVDSSDHCMRLTREPGLASGVLVAWTSDDE